MFRRDRASKLLGSFSGQHSPNEADKTTRKVKNRFCMTERHQKRIFHLKQRIQDAGLVAAFRLMRSGEIDVGYHSVQVYHITYIGEFCWELHVRITQTVHDPICDAGGEFGLHSADMQTLNSLHLELTYRDNSVMWIAQITRLRRTSALPQNWVSRAGSLAATLWRDQGARRAKDTDAAIFGAISRPPAVQQRDDYPERASCAVSPVWWRRTKSALCCRDRVRHA